MTRTFTMNSIVVRLLLMFTVFDTLFGSETETIHSKKETTPSTETKPVVPEREMTFDFIADIIGITEVKSRDERKKQNTPVDKNKNESIKPVISLEELREGELETMCEKGRQFLINEANESIESLEKRVYGEQKKYVIQIARDDSAFDISILPAIQCPFHPPMYVYIKSKDPKTGALEISVLYKDRGTEPYLTDIKVYGIRLAEYIAEAYSDEISVDTSSTSDSGEEDMATDEVKLQSLNLNDERFQNVEKYKEGVIAESKNGPTKKEADESEVDDEDESEVGEEDENESEYEEGNFESNSEDESHEHVENSLIDMDDLHPSQRWKMCRRGVRVISYMNVTLKEDETIGPARFYALTTKQTFSLEEADRTPIDDVKTTVIQAIRCPATPHDIYLNVDEYEDVDDEPDAEDLALMWVIVQRGDVDPLFNIHIYQLKLYVKITEVSGHALVEVRRKDVDKSIKDFIFNLDNLDQNTLRELCTRAIISTLREGVELRAKDIEIEPSAYYHVNFPYYWLIVQAIACPTNKDVNVYVHVGNDERTGKRLAVVFAADNEHLSPWV